MRLIDADALADALFEKRKNYPQWVTDTIGGMPTIDVDVLLKEQESKTGHWNGFPNNGVYDYRCSECGLILTLGMPYSKFCPGCGAKMEGR